MLLVWFLKMLVGSLLLPPGNGLALLGLAGLFRRRRWAFGVAVLGGGLLFLQSLPLVASALMESLENRAGTVAQAPNGAQAIVVLGSGLVNALPQYGGIGPSERTLMRLRHGAELARRWDLPVLVSGGQPFNMDKSEAAVMAETLGRQFNVPVRWKEELSLDTADNARLSAAILREAGIRRIALVTQAFHMPRAVLLFEAAGLEVVPAPTHFVTKFESGDIEVLDFVPRASSLQYSYYALHEWLGIAWARLAIR